MSRLRRAVTAFAVQQLRGPRQVLLGHQVLVELTPPSRHPPIPTATWTLLTDRLGRLAQRLRSLFARIEAGTIAPPRVSPAPAHPPALRPQREHPPYPRLPSARGWINARVAEAAPCGGEMHMLLQDPATAALVSAAPQAGRLLRPLCRALAVDLPDWLRLPARTPAP